MVGDFLTVTLLLEDVSNLYGADMHLAFDPNILEVVDAEPRREGMQVRHGLLPDPAQSVVPRDAADNAAGTVHYAISLKAPAQPANGRGALCTITFHVKAPGFSPLSLVSAMLVDRNARSLPVGSSDSWVRVSPRHLLYLPSLIKTTIRALP